VPRRMVIAEDRTDQHQVFCSEVRKAGSVRKYRKFSSPTKLSLPGSAGYSEALKVVVIASGTIIQMNSNAHSRSQQGPSKNCVC